MKKKLLLLSVILMFSFVTVGANGSATVFVNGREIVSDTPTVIVNGSTMLPFRAVFNALGVPDNQITWDGKSSSIEVKTENKFIFLVIGTTGAIVNDTLIMLDNPPYIQDGRTMVPVRFVSESLGAVVEWDEVNKKVLITK